MWTKLQGERLHRALAWRASCWTFKSHLHLLISFGPHIPHIHAEAKFFWVTLPIHLLLAIPTANALVNILAWIMLIPFPSLPNAFHGSYLSLSQSWLPRKALSTELGPSPTLSPLGLTGQSPQTTRVYLTTPCTFPPMNLGHVGALSCMTRVISLQQNELDIGLSSLAHSTPKLYSPGHAPRCLLQFFRM